MRPRARHLPALGLLATVLLAVLAIGGELMAKDTVLLKSGEIFHGRILRANRDEVSGQLESGNRHDLRRVLKFLKMWSPAGIAPNAERR